MSATRPLPARLTERMIVDATVEQRAAWLAEAEATAPARAARIRETLAGIAKPAPAPVQPLPVGADREALTRLYEAWQDAQVAAGKESCDHGQSLARTCLTCYDGRVWERAAAPAAADPVEESAEWKAYRAAEARWQRTGSGVDEDAMIEAGLAAAKSSPWVAPVALTPYDFGGEDAPHAPSAETIRQEIKDMAARIAEATTDISLSLQDAGATDESEADEEAERLVGIVLAAAREPAEPYAMPLPPPPAPVATLDLDALAARLQADILTACRREFVTVARAEEIAEAARKAVEALSARVEGIGSRRVFVGVAKTGENLLARPAPKLAGYDETDALRRNDAPCFVATESVRKGDAVYVSASPAPVRTLRASALPLFRLCSASADRTPEMILVESTGEPARLGDALHELAAHMVAHGRKAARERVEELAAKHDVDADDLDYLAHQAGEAWAALSHRFPRASVEAELVTDIGPGARLTGHPDLTAIDGRTLRVLDWKSGRARYDAREQVTAYARQVLDNLGVSGNGIYTVEVYVAWLRDGQIERLTFAAAEVLAWGDDLAKRMTASPLPFSPGAHCVQCPRCADCPAKAAWVRQAVAEFAPGGTTAEALAAARAVAKAAEQAIEAIRVQAITAGIDGIEVKETRKVTVRFTHPAVPQAVREALAGEAMAAGGKVRSALLKVLGLKGPEADEEMARLEAAGAAKVTITRKVGEE